MKLNVRAFALTCGLGWGVTILIVTVWIMLLDGATHEPTFIGTIYRGYNISIPGALIGMVWGLFDGLVGGSIFAWLYNMLAGKVKTSPA